MFPRLSLATFCFLSWEDDAFLIGRDCQMHFAVYCREDAGGEAEREQVA